MDNKVFAKNLFSQEEVQAKTLTINEVKDKS